jgi:hypothetical protein
MDENKKFEEIVNRGIEEYFKQNPRIAVIFGKKEYEKEVESGTKEHLEENLIWFGQWIDDLKQLEFEKLNFENQITLETMEYYQNINLFMHEEYPLWKKKPNGLEYFQEIAYLLFQRKGPNRNIAEVINIHLKNLPKYLEEFQSRFDETPIPAVWRDLALEEIQTIPLLFQNLTSAFIETNNVHNSLRNELISSFKEAESVIQTHLEWVKTLPVDNNDFAWALGPEKFDKLLNLRKLPWNRETLLKKGKEAFNLLLKKLKRFAKEIDPKKSLSDVIKDFLEKDQIPTFEEVLLYARSEAERAKQFIKSKNLITFPQEKLVIVETPPHLTLTIPDAAYYDAPYFNKDQPGIFVITPPKDKKEKPTHYYTMISNAMVHEAYPGHHLDFVYNNIFAPLPRLLGSSLETIEGWAHYCEEMMLIQGFHQDFKKAEILNTGAQLFRAIRVTLDIQMHCKQRAIEDAIKLIVNVLGLDETNAKKEVLRYTYNPGYNLSYLIGKLLIQDLKKEVEDKMGNKFSLKFFHDTILRSGDLPYFLLKEYFEEKIRE